MGLICWSAGRLTTTAEETLAGWQKIGEILGTLDQIHDDVVDLWSREQSQTDLQAHQRWSLPLAYVMEVYPAEQKAELQQLLEQLPHSETQVREKIIASGAAVYLHVQTEMLYRQAAALVAQLAPQPEHQNLLLNWLSACRLLTHE
jgi:geranylgeranyl pyrophosphate synthase